MEKTWFMAPMEYSPSGKDIMAPMNYTLVVNSPNGKGMVLWKIVFLFFEVVIIMVKDKNYSIKETMSIKISFIHYRK